MRPSKKYLLKQLSIFLIVVLFYQMLFPVAVYALTGGPSQPETETFSPVSSTDMVDLFSGDFKYNIPLVDVGGYPINLIYNSNPTMDQEASWVGLGWNLNPGAVTRSLRGLPDDFSGDVVHKSYKIKDNKSWGVDIGAQLKFFGIPISLTGGISDNNYKGYGINAGISASISSSKGGGGDKTGSLGINFSSQDGVSLSASAQMETKGSGEKSFNNSIGLSYNSRAGLKDLSLSTSAIKNVSTAANISFAATTFTPTISMPLHNNAYTLSATIGGEIFGIHPNVNINGYWSKQSLKSNSRDLPAYGYINSKAGSNIDNAMLDFNREKDVPWVKTIPNLPIPDFTYDLFMANGQGVSGQFRAHRGDVGILFDSKISSGSESSDAGIEIGFGNAFHAAVPINQVDVTTTTGKWSSTNSLEPNMDFVSPDYYTGFENNYFACNGEQVRMDDDYYSKIRYEDPIINNLIPGLCTNRNTFSSYSISTNGNLGTFGITSKVAKQKRSKRAQLFSYLTAEEASQAGLTKDIYSFIPDSLPYKSVCELVTHGRDGIHDADLWSYQKWSRLGGPSKSHHISEITITKTDGKRYLYGIPAYNFLQKDVTFNCRDLGTEPVDGLVPYVPGTDNSAEGNNYGVDTYFNSETVPGYAYSYLLTGILSPDYIDRTGNGISFDDPGEAIKLNYSRVSDDYRWRVPYDQNMANYNGGLHAGNGNPIASCKGDAKGTYSYGQKELWYMHSVESKTLIAMFYLADRFDGTGVMGEDGGYNSSDKAKQKLLKEIKLFSKSDIVKYGNDAIPIKTIHFVYDYTLCPGVPNNLNPLAITNTGQYDYYETGSFDSNRGKLTLKKVYFTYGDNTKGQLNSYQFQYSGSNPAYGLKNYDRWGNYKDNPSTYPSNAEFPYCIQDSALANQYSQAWNLQEIDLPSGGNIQVNYEADDYAYVQNRRAGQMFFVKGFGTTSSSIATTNTLYVPQGDQYDVLFIKVDDSSGDIKRKYFEGLDKIFYRFSVDLGSTSVNDYVQGYADIDKTGDWCGVYDATTIYVRLKKKNGKNPIAKSAWQYVKNNMPEVAYPGSGDPGGDLGDALIGLIGSIGEIVSIIKGGDDYASDNKKWAKSFDASHSWVRLVNPNYRKIGGGSRVKLLTVSDLWASMAPSGISKTYGQEYLYGDTTNGEYISSGVASWEPSIGNDENPFRQPVDYNIPKPMIQDDYAYLEEPFGESFFPSPSVGYSKVIVANISDQQVRRTATGFTINEFYTAKDFPVITAQTIPERRKLKPPFKLSVLGSTFSLERFTVSQGYSIEVNDMHGKEKAVKVYNAMGAEISSNYYYYKTDNSIPGKTRLSNKADVISNDGYIENATVGEDIDLALDMREQSTNTAGFGLTFNTESFLAYVIFAVIPIPVPKITIENTKFRSAVSCKVIHKYGILDRIVATKDGSTIETKNLLRDAETGEVLLTQTQNEFGDSLYNFTYPAHWAYPNMRSGYSSIGLVLRNVEAANGEITGMTAPFSYLSEGDLLIAKNQNGQTDTAIYRVGRFESNGKLRLMHGQVAANINHKVDLKIIQTGIKNMASVPIGTLATIHKAPIDSVSFFEPRIAPPQSNFILQASATEFADRWKIDCNKVLINSCDTIHPEFCLDQLINLILSYNQANSVSLWNACYSDSITVGSIYEQCNCNCAPDSINDQDVFQMPFFNPICPSDLSEVTTQTWSFGECALHMESLSGNAIDMDSLQIVDPIDSASSCSKVYVGANHTDSVNFCVECINCHDSCADFSAMNLAVDPYQLGMFNNWHMKRSWSYYSRRTPVAVRSSIVRDEGTFKEFTPFWTVNSTTHYWDKTGTSDANWVATNTVTRINKEGAEIENVDALDRYSAALYGYLETLPKAISSNAKYKEIANDNFEDYSFRPTCKFPCFAEHWNFADAISTPYVFISDTVAHSGHSSLFVASGHSASVYRDINYTPEDTLVLEDTVNYQYLMHNGCIGKFSPDSGTYLISAWVKESGSCGPLGYDQDSIQIDLAGSSTSIVFYPSGTVIEGWQRYEGLFEVPGTATGITVNLIAGDNNTYFDDIRIHPYHSNMKSFVNDARSLKLMSELDANNYATFYEYDDEGKLVRVKKETERGIMTLKESRSVYRR